MFKRPSVLRRTGSALKDCPLQDFHVCKMVAVRVEAVRGGRRTGNRGPSKDSRDEETFRTKQFDRGVRIVFVVRPTVLMQQSSRGVPESRQKFSRTTVASEISLESGAIIVQALVPYKAGDLKRAVMHAGRASAKSANPCR